MKAHDSTSALLLFYNENGTDHRGRMLSQIVRKSDRWLEETHDYIQWLFPLYAPSQFNPDAPLLTEDVCVAFNDSSRPDSKILQQNFSAAIYRMLVFYGYSVSPLAPNDVSPTGEWRDKSANWLTDGNHNFMRITRMLRCMCLLGRAPLAQSWHHSLNALAKVHPKTVSSRTLGFWNEAITLGEVRDLDAKTR